MIMLKLFPFLVAYLSRSLAPFTFIVGHKVVSCLYLVAMIIIDEERKFLNPYQLSTDRDVQGRFLDVMTAASIFTGADSYWCLTGM